MQYVNNHYLKRITCNWMRFLVKGYQAHQGAPHHTICSNSLTLSSYLLDIYSASLDI